MFEPVEKIVGPYKKPKAEFHTYDNRAPDAAGYLKEKIESYMPQTVIEHIGSTAIPGCPGKGVVDMMALYPTDHLEIVVALLKALGFQRQGKEFKNRFPDERPVMMGTFEYDAQPFLVYIHVIHEDSYEAVRFRIFRDRLCEDAELLADYIAVKKRIIEEGVTDTDDYAVMKQSIIRRILGDDYKDPPP
jgi:GrpB-like predicted nucleotidyltransferase (UPF0157 family)